MLNQLLVRLGPGMWTRPDPPASGPDSPNSKIFRTRPDPTRHDPRVDPTREQLCMTLSSLYFLARTSSIPSVKSGAPKREISFGSALRQIHVDLWLECLLKL